MTLDRRTPLPAPRTPMARSAPLARAALPRQARSSPASRPRQTGPTPQVRQEVYGRDRGACVRCASADGPFQVHHRRPRAAGGTRRLDANSPANLVLLCEPCHRHVESHRTEALAAGLLLPQGRPRLSAPSAGTAGTSCSPTTAPSPRSRRDRRGTPRAVAVDDALAAAEQAAHADWMRQARQVVASPCSPAGRSPPTTPGSGSTPGRESPVSSARSSERMPAPGSSARAAVAADRPDRSAPSAGP